ncbi:hypothetical protein V8G54_015214, partial [Vigna mungo]
GRLVEGKGVERKVLDIVHESYNSELNRKDFVYDGEETLFTPSSLSRNHLEFIAVLEDVVSVGRNNGNASPDGHGEISENDKKRMRRPNRAKTYKVEINFSNCRNIEIRYSALTTLQRSSLVEKYRQKPLKMMKLLTDVSLFVISFDQLL